MARALVVKIIGDPSELSASLKAASAETDKFANTTTAAHKAMHTAVIASTAVLGGLALGLEKSVKAAETGQVAQAALDTALKNTHQSVVAMTPALNAAEAAAR